jgi:hypothetical protein
METMEVLHLTVKLLEVLEVVLQDQGQRVQMGHEVQGVVEELLKYQLVLDLQMVVLEDRERFNIDFLK